MQVVAGENIQIIWKETPLTSSGIIQVNGITASTFISFQKESDEYFMLKGGIGQLLSHHELAHRAITPFWFYCTTIAFCDEATNEMPAYVSKGMDLIEWSQLQHILLSILMWAFSCGLLQQQQAQEDEVIPNIANAMMPVAGSVQVSPGGSGMHQVRSQPEPGRCRGKASVSALVGMPTAGLQAPCKRFWAALS